MADGRTDGRTRTDGRNERKGNEATRVGQRNDRKSTTAAFDLRGWLRPRNYFSSIFKEATTPPAVRLIPFSMAAAAGVAERRDSQDEFAGGMANCCDDWPTRSDRRVADR